jgi:hypothetical protein
MPKITLTVPVTPTTAKTSEAQRHIEKAEGKAEWKSPSAVEPLSPKVSLSYIDGRNMPRAHGRSDMPVWGTLFGYVAEAGKLLDPKQQPIPQKVQQNIASIAKYLESIQER